MKYHKILNNFFQGFCCAKSYAEKHKIDLVPPAEENFMPTIVNNRIGYIVATCSPPTKAHIELANKSVIDLNLDALYFIIWPFHYISGFHSTNMLDWVSEQKHYSWDIRVALLKLAIREFGNNKIKVLDATKEWYKESEKEFDYNNKRSYFWTGSWYVIRRLQSVLDEKINGNNNISYYFISGSDQFNPNIYALINDGTEKIWKDYSIAEHLSLHNYYAVDRGNIEFFMPPNCIKNKIIFSNKLKYTDLSATKVRFSKNLQLLKNICLPTVANKIIEKNLWGYKA